MASGRISPLTVQEYLAAADPRFLDALRQLDDLKALASIAEKWKRDHRPWARDQIKAYLDLPMNAPNHHPVVKRLFKHFEQTNDDEMMACFLVAFDRFIRREMKRRHRYNSETRQTWSGEVLVSPANSLKADTGKRRPYRGYFEQLSRQRLFTHHTRQYLRRRAWRYYRFMGYRRPKEYTGRVAMALKQYRDDDVASGANLLDCWGLVHACFGESEVLKIGASHVNLAPGQSLSKLEPAPYFPELWNDRSAMPVLLELLAAAQSRLVRVWAIKLLRRSHREHLAGVSADQVAALLGHADEEVQQFAAELLEHVTGTERWPVEAWLGFLQIRSPLALEAIAAAMARVIRADQLTLAQAVELARAEPAPVARLGLGFLRQRSIDTDEDRALLATLAAARSEAVGRELAAFALSILGADDRYDVERVIPFFDSLLGSIRRGTWDWLTGEPAPKAANDPVLWSRLFESPYDDVRLRFVAELERRTSVPGATAESLGLLWRTVLLNIHRGGRAKLAALRQIGAAILNDPARCEPLLPVMAVALRSVRLPEMRGGLAAVVQAVEAHPALADAVARHFPELRLGEPLTTGTGGATWT